MSRKNKQFKSHKRKRHITLKLTDPIKRSTVKRSPLKHKTMKRKIIIGGSHSQEFNTLIKAFNDFKYEIDIKIGNYNKISNRN